MTYSSQWSSIQKEKTSDTQKFLSLTYGRNINKYNPKSRGLCHIKPESCFDSSRGLCHIYDTRVVV